ncbi:MAG: proteasome accessory factor PafA2 [Actinobacteria bacterium]|nr:proteasome accessory factor PafA2 [Actinomycetota bacterium]MCB9388752.1 proteasome accessory factor PafA2 [Acidimicrobiia bacterium]
MAAPKILGLETEFGIVQRGTSDWDPVAASSLVVRSYTDRAVAWNFDDEHPERDARGRAERDGYAPMVETAMLNTVLTNGARLYVDHAHPEYSSPEVRTPREAVLFDRAGEEIAIQAMRRASARLPEGEEVILHKNNADGKGNSYGCHENYLIARQISFDDVIAMLVPWFVSRQIFAGAGKVGAENGRPDVPFQLSQRADFFEAVVGIETTLKRPIVNTRDEPHADPKHWRRLHVIVGDANLCETATWLKVGLTALVLAALEDGFTEPPIRLAHPVRSMWQVSHDSTCRALLESEGGTTISALDLQWEFLALVDRYVEATGGLAVTDEKECAGLLDTWERVLNGLEHDPDSLVGVVDWITKGHLIESFASRDGLADDDPKLALIDLQYHDLRPDRSLFQRLKSAGRVDVLLDPSDVATALYAPPESTRAYFRGTCLSRWPDEVRAASWDSLVFDVGGASLQRVATMDPLKGTRDLVGDIFDSVTTAGDLLARLAR